MILFSNFLGSEVHWVFRGRGGGIRSLALHHVWCSRLLFVFGFYGSLFANLA